MLEMLRKEGVSHDEGIGIVRVDESGRAIASGGKFPSRGKGFEGMA